MEPSVCVLCSQSQSLLLASGPGPSPAPLTPRVSSGTMRLCSLPRLQQLLPARTTVATAPAAHGPVHGRASCAAEGSWKQRAHVLCATVGISTRGTGEPRAQQQSAPCKHTASQEDVRRNTTLLPDSPGACLRTVSPGEEGSTCQPGAPSKQKENSSPDNARCLLFADEQPAPAP